MTEARLEFRAFGDGLIRPRAAIRDRMTATSRDSREDVYLSDGRPDWAFKLRNGSALDLKHCAQKVGRFERWEPMGLMDLPARGAALTRCFGAAPGFPALEPGQTCDAEDLLAAFTNAGHIARTVRKDRVQFEADTITAEIARIDADFSPDTWTVAIEGTDMAALEDWHAALGLDGLRNVSYPRWIAASLP
ncbi:hypothetical protein [Chachezhania antarctica]|uniref:hypothetical protein n=1 Tax=Chachezhania antarctica TaxID=2340860 RepID=UPI000EAC6A27|nr:hypothetical protein [Chachezhania antarctica]|tara:strand:- start:5309 stop:5881 length:573 start_codon:yes stop_codon:yes gene_type:complete